MHRLFDRIRPMLLNGGLSLMAPLINALSAWWVIRQSSEEVWGSFVAPMVVAGLSLHVLSWGNREFLLREFARHPERIGSLWRQNFATRGSLLLVALPMIFLLGFAPEAVPWLMLWVCAGFVRQSFEVVVVARKDFSYALVVEMLAAGLLLGGLIWGTETLEGTAILRWYALAWAARSVGMLFRYGGEFLPGDYGGIEFAYFGRALPFFLLGFAGLLLSRIDLYCVTLFVEDDAQVGRYQLLMSFFLYLQATAGFILLPYVRNIYRLPDRSIRRLSRRLGLLGIPITVAGVAAVAALLYYAYGVSFPLDFYLIGALFVAPIFFFSPLIYLLFKHERQQAVVMANAVGIVVNLGLNLLLIPYFGVLGALIATTCGQGWSMAVILRFSNFQFPVSNSPQNDEA
jgi:O-antigen/teichoic acid export membrane protein